MNDFLRGNKSYIRRKELFPYLSVYGEFLDKAKDTPKEVRGSFMMVMFDSPYLFVNRDLNKLNIPTSLTIC